MMADNLDALIELRVENTAQLFHTLDPFPFRERDLDREAEEFIVGWAQELPGSASNPHPHSLAAIGMPGETGSRD